MITQQQIEDKARDESIRKVADYAPGSYKAGFVDGAVWIINELKQQMQ